VEDYPEKDYPELAEELKGEWYWLNPVRGVYVCKVCYRERHDAKPVAHVRRCLAEHYTREGR